MISLPQLSAWLALLALYLMLLFTACFHPSRHSPPPNLACQPCPPLLSSAFAFVVRHCRLPALQPSLPLCCLRCLLPPTLVLPCCTPPPNLASHCHLPPLLSAMIIICQCCCCLPPPSSTATISLPLCCFCCLLPPVLILPCHSLTPNLACCCHLPWSASAIAIIVRCRRLLPLHSLIATLLSLLSLATCSCPSPS